MIQSRVFYSNAIRIFAIGIFFFLVPEVTAASLDISRYPFRIPDWLWQDVHRTRILSPSTKDHLDTLFDVLQRINDSPYQDEINRKSDEFATALNGAFNIRYLATNGITVTDDTTSLHLVLQFDPIFSHEQRTMLTTAAKRFLSVASNRDVIATAIARSSETPVGTPVDSDAPDQYRIFIQSRRQPPNVDVFQKILKHALSATSTGDPPVLVISAYSGNLWWGCGILNFNTSIQYKVGRDEAPQGLLSIALNTDKLQPPEPHSDDPSFWASKIAHEILHNMGYWHPNYLSPEERDRANSDDHDNAFIIAYENGIFSTLSQSVAIAAAEPRLVPSLLLEPQHLAHPTLRHGIWIGDSLARKP